MKKHKGITLIALVITIIILLILAGVSLKLITGEEGILKRTSTAVEKTNEETAREELELAVVDAKIKWYEDGKPGTITEYMEKYLNNYKTSTGGTINATKNGDGTLTLTYKENEKTSEMGKIDKDGNLIMTENGEMTNPLEGLTIGSIITYSPSGTYNWNAEYATSYDKTSPEYSNVNKNLNSGTEDFQITTWKVLNIDSATGKVQMVPSTPTTGSVTLQGAQGYNNAVKLLNDACSDLYSNTSKGITARSINIEDIEKCMTEDGINRKNNYTNGILQYGIKHTTQYSNLRNEQGAFIYNKSYPIMYGRESIATIDGTERNDGLGMNEQSELIQRNDDGATEGRLQASTSIHPTQWYYHFANDFQVRIKKEYRTMLLNGGYWVASRCVGVVQEKCVFTVRYVSDKYLDACYTYWSDNINTAEKTLSLFPVVTLNSSSLMKDAENGFKIK